MMRKIYADVALMPRTDSTVSVKTVYREALALKQLGRLDLVVKFFKRTLDFSSADVPRDKELEDLRAYISGDLSIIDILNKNPAELENEMQANERGILRAVMASMDHASPGNILGLLNLSGSYPQNLSFLEEFITRPRARSGLAVTEATT